VIRAQRILDGGPVQVHLDHGTTGGFHGLLDGSRHFTRLATTEAHTTIAVANYCQRCEGKDPTAFDDLGDAVNLNQIINVTLGMLLIEISHTSTLRLPARLHQRRRPALSRGHDTRSRTGRRRPEYSRRRWHARKPAGPISWRLLRYR